MTTAGSPTTKTAMRKLRRSIAPEPARLSGDSFLSICGQLRTICCSEAWIDSIMAELSKPRGQRRIHYVTDDRGRLKTKMSDLLMEIELAGFYPPPADDGLKRHANGSVRRYGSAMRPCLSRACTGEHGGETRSILYPAAYLRMGAICETCAQNHTDLDERAEELGFDQSAVGMSPSAAGNAAMRYYGLKVRWQKTKLAARKKRR